jgi:hypothetical protein
LGSGGLPVLVRVMNPSAWVFLKGLLLLALAITVRRRLVRAQMETQSAAGSH